MTTRIITHGDTAWLDLAQPQAADIAALQSRFPFIHPLHVEDISSRVERPKLDENDDYLFLVLHFPLWDADEQFSRAAEVDFFIGRGFVVTVHNGSLKPLTRMAERCEAAASEREHLLGRGATHAFHSLVDGLVDYIFPILAKVDGRVNAIEDALFESDAKRVIQEIALLRRDIISLRRIIRQQIPIARQLEAAEHALLHDELEEYFGDIADHLLKQRDIIEENYEVINSLAETADTLASYRINEVMRILTVISVIMLPLTLISSIYGMNIELPFAADPNAFIMAAAIMILIALAMLIYFRKRHWL